MLEISREILEATIAQAREGFPLEVCGMMGGVGHRVTTRYPMTNTDASNEHFTMDPKEQFAVVRAMRAVGEKMLVIYHSHPDSPARPSTEDIRLAFTPNVCHLIVSLEHPDEPMAKAFRISAGVVEPVQLTVAG